jgi:hypothetical protein
VYDLLDTRLFVYATHESTAFLEARVRRYARFRSLPLEEERAALEAERRRLEKVTEFHLAVHANDPRMDDFDRPNSMWRLALAAQGRESSPLSVERVGRTNPEQRAFYSYMEPFWVGYRVRFPKASGSMTLKVSSSVGKAELAFVGE